jgi:hydrogenase maturation protease
MPALPGEILVLGVGNILLRDEGVGVAVIHALSSPAGDDLPEGTTVVDGGTLGLDLLPMIGTAAALVMVDAVNLRQPPGSVAVIRGDAIHGTLAGHVSPHQVGIGDLVAAARLLGSLPPHVSLVAIQPGAIEIGLELTPEVAAAVPIAADVVREECRLLALQRDVSPEPVTAGAAGTDA